MNGSNAANEVFEVSLIISEDKMVSEKFVCSVKPLSELEQLKNEYDIVFICSEVYQELVQVLLQMGWRKEQIRLEDDIFADIYRKLTL